MWVVSLNMNDNYLMLSGNGVGFNLHYQQMNNMVMFNAMQFKNGRYQSIIGHDPLPEHVTKNGARIYGFASLGLGAGLAWLAFSHPRK